jgi:hypothetical protein
MSLMNSLPPYDEETRKSIGQMKRVHRLRSLIVPESG